MIIVFMINKIVVVIINYVVFFSFYIGYIYCLNIVVYDIWIILMIKKVL